MAIGTKDRNKILTFGALAGLTTPILLKFIVMPILNFLAGIVPGISAKLAEPTATISVSVRESLTGIEGGLSGWLVDALGLTVSVPMMTYIMAAVGGALFFLVGAYAADAIGWLKGNAEQKTRAVIFAGSAIAAFVLGGFAVPSIGIGLVDTLIALGINAAILAYVYVGIDKAMKLKLIPF